MVCGACAGSRPAHGRDAAATAAGHGSNGVVLYESHSITGDTGADTLVTWVAEGRVRVTHRVGVAILDATNDRFVLLDPATRTVRAMSLLDWEAKLRDAVQAAVDSAPGAPPHAAVLSFEPAGDGGSVAGFQCALFHLFTTRQLFPGEWEDVEQEIWVSRDLALSAGALATYERVLESLDWIGLDARVERPPGIALRTRIRRHSHAASPGADEVETNEVFRVENRAVPDSIFAIPPGYSNAVK